MRLSADDIFRLLDYDIGNGLLRWRNRSIDMFEEGGHSAAHNCAVWNAKYAGKTAGTKDGAGYIQIKIFGSFYLAHRIAWLLMTGEWPAAEIDHKNLDKADNRWSNLRVATRSQNEANKRVQRNNTSGLKGVFWSKRKHKWAARIRKNGKVHYLGLFDTQESAHCAYVTAAEALYGEFARAT